MSASLVGSEMCIRDRASARSCQVRSADEWPDPAPSDGAGNVLDGSYGHGRYRLGAAAVWERASAPGPFDSAAGNGGKRFGPWRDAAAREPFAPRLPPG
eukprot:2783990-Alexandrium_andersonii.AAC.1